MACLRTLPTSLMSSVAVRTAAFMPARRRVRTGEKLEGSGTLSEEDDEEGSRRGPVDLEIVLHRNLLDEMGTRESKLGLKCLKLH